MKLTFTSIFILLLSCSVFAQTAPDFEVTDANGNVHRLYEDYLDQGQSVLIKIFFTTCPPCRSIAASTEIYYQEWGAGDHDVEFIELSNKTWDDDDNILGYQEDFGITFPSAGADGGSNAAVQPYTSGDFGPFFGTPTFVVIGPDGTVYYDPSGPDRWQALDDALHATGALKPGEDTTTTPDPVIIDVGGHIHRFNGENDGIEGVEVSVITSSGNLLLKDTSDILGEYAFRIDSAVVADSMLQIEVYKTSDPKNGVTATDLLLIQKHLLGLAPFEANEKLFASDANLSSSISAADLLFLKKLLLDLEPHFSDGQSWMFFHSDVDLGQPQDQPPMIEQGPVLVRDIISGDTSPNFKGIKRGDVNESAQSQD